MKSLPNIDLNSEKAKKCYIAYEKVRRSGKYNMFDPLARYESRLSEEDYIWVMQNYSKLHELYDEEVH